MDCEKKMGYGLRKAMKHSRDFQIWHSRTTWRFLRARVLLALLAPALFVASAGVIHAQVVPPGNRGTLKLSAGVIGSGDTFQYGPRKMLGVGAFVDGETTGHFGIEAEGRWVEFHQRANVHAETYSIGGRYHFDFGRRWQPYAKGLVGFGDFNFPYNYATGQLPDRDCGRRRGLPLDGQNHPSRRRLRISGLAPVHLRQYDLAQRQRGPEGAHLLDPPAFAGIVIVITVRCPAPRLASK